MTQHSTSPDAVPRETSAGRLLHLVQTMLQCPSTMPMVQVWKGVYQLPTDDVIEIFRGVTMAAALLDTFKRDVAQLPPRRAAFITPYMPMFHAVLQCKDLSTQWLHLAGHFAEPLPSRLEAIHMDLEDVAPAEIPGERREHLHHRAERLRTEIETASGLPTSLRLAMLELVDHVVRALRTYHLTGNAGLEDVLTHVLSVTRHHAPDLRQHEDHPVVRRAGGLVSRLEAALRTATRYAKDPHFVVAVANLCVDIVALAPLPATPALPPSTTVPAVAFPGAPKLLVAGAAPPDATAVAGVGSNAQSATSPEEPEVP